MFQPLVPSSSGKTTTAAAVKSVIELLIMSKTYDSKVNHNPQVELVQQLLSKVVEDSCKWVGITL